MPWRLEEVAGFELVPIDRDAITRVAVASFLARYRGPTLTAYLLDLRIFLAWCRSVEVEPLRVTRGQLEMYLRALDGCGYAAAPVTRRFTTVAKFFHYAAVDELTATNPAATVSRPKVAWEGQRRTVHPLEFAALLTTARAVTPTDHAMVLGSLDTAVGAVPAALGFNLDISTAAHTLLHGRRQTH